MKCSWLAASGRRDERLSDRIAERGEAGALRALLQDARAVLGAERGLDADALLTTATPLPRVAYSEPPGALARAVELLLTAGDESLPLPHRVIARAYLAEVLLLQGDVQPAISEAREAFETATRIGLRLATIQAAYTLSRASASGGTMLDVRVLEVARRSMEAFETEASDAQAVHVTNDEWKRYKGEIQ